MTKGIGQNASELASKGYDTSVTGNLASLATKLTEEATRYDEMNAAVTAQRHKCHEILDQLKAAINESKAGIKSRYDPIAWSRFGLVDKR